MVQIVDHAWFQRLKPRYDGPLSNFAVDFNLRRYNEATGGLVSFGARPGVVRPGAGPGGMG